MRCLATRLLCEQMHPWLRDPEDSHCLLFGVLQIWRVVNSSNFQIRSPHDFGIVDHLPFSFPGETSVGGKVRDKTGEKSEAEETSFEILELPGLWQIGQDARHDRRGGFLHGGSKKKGTARYKASQFPPKLKIDLNGCFCQKIIWQFLSLSLQS